MKNIALLTLGVLFISCGGKKEKEPSLKSQNFAAARNAFFSSLHNPKETFINLSPGLPEFDPKVLNNPESYFQYISSDIKAAANLGIYLSDLNYCILYKADGSIKKYFEVSYELSKVIGIEKNTLDFLANRYAQNITSNDSVKLVMQQLLDQATVGLQGTNREKLAGVAMAAHQIETLYLVLSILESFPENLTEDQEKSQKLLFQYVLNQYGKFEIVYNFIQSFSDPLDPDKNPNYPFFDNALRELIGSYKQFSLGTPEDFQMKNNPLLKDLKEKINTIRVKIISAE